MTNFVRQVIREFKISNVAVFVVDKSRNQIAMFGLRQESVLDVLKGT